MSFLMVLTPEGQRQRFELRDAVVRIGRSRENDLILKDPMVSRVEHARIEPAGGSAFQLRVMGSRTVLLNGAPASGVARLEPGDAIRIGRSSILFDSRPETTIELGGECLDFDGMSTPPSPETLTAREMKALCRGCPVVRDLDVILAASEALALDAPLPEFFTALLDLSGRVAPFERGVLMTLENGELVEQAARLPSADWERRFTLSRTITEHVVRCKEAILASDAIADERFCAGSSVSAQGIRSMMCVPLLSREEVIGILYLDNREHSGVFNKDSLRYLTLLANIAATRLELKRLVHAAAEAEYVRKELVRAAEVQRMLLPEHAPEIPGYEAHAISDPCFSVGGDYFDYLPYSGGRHAFILADVSGKGLSSSLIMSCLDSSSQFLAEFDFGPQEMANRLNAWLARHLPGNRFITSFIGLLDPSHNTLSYVNAGHLAPLLARSGGELERLTATGPPFGVVPDASYGLRRTGLDEGDILIAFSDGVTEAENSMEEQFGTEGVERILLRSLGDPPGIIVQTIREAIAEHRGDQAAQDDVTLMAVKRRAS